MSREPRLPSARVRHTWVTVPDLPMTRAAQFKSTLLVCLARHWGGPPLALSDVAAQERLSVDYLEQLAVPLRKAGLIESHRGAHGGYRLSRSPEQITMGEVLRVLEGPIAPMICATEGEMTEICGKLGTCKIQQLWSKVRDAVATTIDAMTLSELVGEPDHGQSSPSQFIAISDIRVAH